MLGCDKTEKVGWFIKLLVCILGIYIYHRVNVKKKKFRKFLTRYTLVDKISEMLKVNVIIYTHTHTPHKEITVHGII